MADALAKDQISKLREAFCNIDKDSDGVITMEELAAAVHPLSEQHTKEEIREMIEEINSHGDHGTIDFEDFLNITTKKYKDSVSEELKEAFKVFDLDQDGFISANELRDVMMNLGERLTDEETQEMIREADLDGDGLVSYDDAFIFLILFIN